MITQMCQTTLNAHPIDRRNQVDGDIECFQFGTTLWEATMFVVRLSGRGSVLAHTTSKRWPVAGCQGRAGGWTPFTTSRWAPITTFEPAHLPDSTGHQASSHHPSPRLRPDGSGFVTHDHPPSDSATPRIMTTKHAGKQSPALATRHPPPAAGHQPPGLDEGLEAILDFGPLLFTAPTDHR